MLRDNVLSYDKPQVIISTLIILTLALKFTLYLQYWLKCRSLNCRVLTLSVNIYGLSALQISLSMNAGKLGKIVCINVLS